MNPCPRSGHVIPTPRSESAAAAWLRATHLSSEPLVAAKIAGLSRGGCVIILLSIASLGQALNVSSMTAALQCDHQVPQCGQCIRQRVKCRGYRDEWDLVFRDQTVQTINRTLQMRANSALVPAGNSLRPSVEDIGVNYFFHNFIVGSRSSSRGCLNYIPSVHHAGSHDSTLAASMAAVGLAALASSRQQLELASHARAKYSEAVRRVNAALTSPVDYAKDSTLMSVISLGVFEQVCEYRSWMIHAQGAAALVVARGKGQFSKPIAIHMFNQVRADLMIACIHAKKPFPEDMLALQQEASKHAEASSPFWFLGELGTRCANLYMSVIEPKRKGELSWTELLSRANLLERDFSDLVSLLVVQEPYTTVRGSVGDPNAVYNGRYDLYSDLWAVRLWNNWRSLRMIVCRIRCFLFNKVLDTDGLASATLHNMEPGLQETLQILSRLGDDILATVPQTLQFLNPASDPSPSADPSLHDSVSGGYMLTWALSMVGKSPTASSETRAWVIQRLQDIGRRNGVSIALQAIDEIMEMDQN